MIETDYRTIYYAWDGWYDTFYREIWKKWDIDFAIVENGQYSLTWRYIHTLPQQLPQTVKELWAKYVIPAHNSKYALSTHLWNEPLKILSWLAEKENINLLTPMIWELVDLDAKRFNFSKWWENVKETDYIFTRFTKKW
jgi:L-ascorbate metabolism protein UlaG (beta-lactamase superfamily)